ncbi:MAG: SGNH/GDSL hydrolase family protein, partial [Elusimicrobia bacterium]|nr:SGNH/GDSL hydrolase family protein [Elusimicrobiota bacterium]
MPPPRNRLAVRAVLVAMGTAAGLAMTEVGLRLLPPSLRANWQRTRYIATREIMHLRFCEPDDDPLVGWRNIPGKEGVFENLEFRTRVRFNSLGLRGPEPAPARLDRAAAPGRRRILALGDSLAVGWGVEEDETFVSRVSRGRPDWEMLNLGVSGYGTRSEWGLLRRLGPELRPDDVVVAFYLNDPEESFIRLVLPSQPPPKRAWWQDLCLSAVVRDALQRRDPREPPYYHRTDARYEAAAAYYLRQIRRWCLDHGARLHVVYLPAKDELKEAEPVGYRKGLAGFCRREGIDLLDATPALAGVRGAYFDLDDHLTPAGHEVVAGLLAEHLDRAPAGPRRSQGPPGRSASGLDRAPAGPRRSQGPPGRSASGLDR